MAEVIETGVDRLVGLVRSKKRISVMDAAKFLNVSKVVIEEWADFLEEEGIISIQYKFTTPYLVERVASKKDVEDKFKEFSGKREGFVRKAEVCLSLLDDKGAAFGKIREDFEKLKQELGKDLESVKSELKLLDKYNAEKQAIESEIVNQERVFRDRIKSMQAQIEKEQARYKDVLDGISKEEFVLDNEKKDTDSIRQMLKSLDTTVSRLKKTVDSIKDKLSSEETIVAGSGLHIDRLKKLAESARKDMISKKEQLTSLLVSKKGQEKKIAALNDSIIKKIMQKKKHLTSDKFDRQNIRKVRNFLSHNKFVDDYLVKISVDKQRLEHDLHELIKKAKAFQFASKSEGVSSYINDLDSKFKQIERDKNAFEAEVRQLRKKI